MRLGPSSATSYCLPVAQYCAVQTADGASSAGLQHMPYVWVNDIQAIIARASTHGAEIVDPPHPDSPGSTSTIATFRDPAGNLIGLYQEQAE